MTHIKSVLADIQAKREALGVELSELDVVEAGLRKLAGEPGGPVLTPPNTAVLEFAKGTLKDFSVREAALNVLSRANGPVRSTELAKVLRAGGIKTKGKNFANQVANVLSRMTLSRETVRTKNGYALAAHGRTVWEQTQPKLAQVGVGVPTN